MIFKTFNTNIDKSLSKIGMFNKSFWAMQQDLKHGNGLAFSIFGGQNVTNRDKQAILDLNTQMKNGVKPAKAWANTMSNCSIAAQEQARQCLKTKGSLTELANGLNTTAAAVTTKAFAMVGNMIAIWAISKGIEFVVKGIDNLAHSAEYCKERVDELVSDFESCNSTIQQHSETISNISSRYSELSHGVNELGGNVSLTNEEYLEYQDICNQIAEMYPTLVKSYDEQGNAIIKLKGNVEALTQALLDEKKANAAKIIESDEVMKNYQNTREHGVFDTLGDYFTHFFDSSDEITASMIAEQEKIQKYKDFLQMSYENIISLSSKIGGDRETIIQRGLLSELGIDSDTTKEEFNTFRTNLQAEIVTIQAVIDQALSAVKTKAGAYLLYNEYYSSLNENEINIISSLLNNIDENTANSFGNDDKKIAAYVNKIVNLIHEAKPEVQKSINAWFILGEDVDISTKVAALDTIIKSYEDNGLVIPVYFEEQKNEFDKLKKQYDDAIQKTKKRFDGYDPTAFFKENSINTQEEIDKWLEIAQAANSAAEAETKYVQASNTTQTFSFPDFTETQSKSIDDFQSKVKTLSEALSSIQSGSLDNGALTDLIQEFPELQGKSEDLEQALKDLIYNLLNTLYSTLGEGLPDDVKNDLQAIANEATNLVPSLDDALSSIQKSYDSLSDFENALSDGNITDSVLSSISSLSGELNMLVASYHSGAVSADELYSALQEHYSNDLENYGKALIAKNEMNDSFYNNVGMTSTEVTNQFAQNYEVDISKCKNYNEAKLKIEQETLKQVSNMWSKYYDTQTRSFTSEADFIFNNASQMDERTKQQYLTSTGYYEFLNQAKKYENAVDGLNQIIYEKVGSNFKRISTDLGNASSSAKNEFEELFDFFERRVKVLDNSLSLLKSSLENVTGSFGKNNLVDAQLSITEEKFHNYTDALTMYTQKANEAFSKLPADIAARVREGAVALTDFVGDGNKDVVEAIKDYESWADEITNCKQELVELQKEIRQLELEKFNNIMKDFSNQFDIREDGKDLISKQIDLLKEAGQLIGESFFTTQIDQSKKQLELLEAEKAQLADQMSSAISSGRVQKGTEEWLEMVNALSDVEGNILDCKKAIEEFDNELLQLHWDIFDRIQEQFSNLDSELSDLGGLFDHLKMSDDKGNWTNEGIAQLGLLTQQYELAHYQIEQYHNEINKLNSNYLAGKYSATEYADKLAELTSAQRDAVNASESIKDAIVELNETRIDEEIEGIEEEIDAYKELVDAQIDALKASKDLHDYERSIAEKTKSITDLERQIAAMQNDTTAATVAKRKLLEEDLAKANKELEETQYEHSIEAQENALNQQYEDYAAERNAEIEALKLSLEDRETLLAQSFETVKANADTVGQEIALIATQHGITVSDAIITSWQNGETSIASYGAVLSENTSAFIGNIIGVETEVYNLLAQANVTAETLAWMFATRADNLVGGLISSYRSEETLNAMTQALHNSLISTLEGGYNISKITDALSSIAEGADSVASAANNAAQALAAMGAAQTSSANNSNNTNRSTYSIHQTGGAYTVKDGKGNIVSSWNTLDQAQDYIKGKNAYVDNTPTAKAGLGTNEKGNANDQKLTKAQTDNKFDWSKLTPAEILPGISLPTVNLPKFDQTKVNGGINIDNKIIFTGAVNDANNFAKQIAQIADKQITKSWKELGDSVKY